MIFHNPLVFRWLFAIIVLSEFYLQELHFKVITNNYQTWYAHQKEQKATVSMPETLLNWVNPPVIEQIKQRTISKHLVYCIYVRQILTCSINIGPYGVLKLYSRSLYIESPLNLSIFVKYS